MSPHDEIRFRTVADRECYDKYAVIGDDQCIKDREYLLGSIEAARALHRSTAFPATRAEDQSCLGCGHRWPCPTTRALDGA